MFCEGDATLLWRRGRHLSPRLRARGDVGIERPRGCAVEPAGLLRWGRGRRRSRGCYRCRSRGIAIARIWVGGRRVGVAIGGIAVIGITVVGPTPEKRI